MYYYVQNNCDIFSLEVLIDNALVQRKEKVTVLKRDKINEKVLGLSVYVKEEGVLI